MVSFLDPQMGNHGINPQLGSATEIFSGILDRPQISLEVCFRYPRDTEWCKPEKEKRNLIATKSLKCKDRLLSLILFISTVPGILNGANQKKNHRDRKFSNYRPIFFPNEPEAEKIGRQKIVT